MASPKTEATCCPIVELRQYTMHPGQRDVLIELFEREFIESQEALGIQVIGQFRDLDDPNRFVWLRGFSAMRARAEALQAFYFGGSVWQAHRAAANATMIDSDNVLLLRPARAGSGFALPASEHRPPYGAREAARGLVVASIFSVDARIDSFLDFWERALMPVVESGATLLGSFVTESSPNTFPALPVREGEQVFAWFAGFADPTAHAEYVATLARSSRWRDALAEALARHLKGPPEMLRLVPTARSQLCGLPHT